MFEYIIGKVTYVCPAYLVLETNGVGYLIYSANPFRYSSKLNQEAKVYVHQAVREDAITLYGFKDFDEKQLYLKLLSVSGIGPKSGLAILANEDHTGLIQAIENEDTAFLTKFPGVGKKTAGQIVLDLKGKLGDLGIEEMGSYGREESQLSSDTHIKEAIEALEALGYGAREVKQVEKELKKNPKESTDAYLREALKWLMKK
ncbi:Holliday junction branch migration protein RuvA [Pisciglobus halotolerans]|uniref:Holliday junction branch migration complex subunit RuvA n=1 Tax=Pisciglobus halotolerans TaxID=745365 RepID=A0A1I3CSX5_9LACT|nr:Holliday junction branch migration protein RuvA [Pisciglobus halotolerans]SFH77369.1 Holliday junction DNA helicase subunit RuvA [Pisciglobus halotolerans]